MIRIASSLFLAPFAMLLVACNKAPAPAVAASTPSSTTVAAAPAAAVVTYQCHSEQKGRDIFLRFDADGALYLGADAADMKPTGNLVLFGKSNVATWTKKQGSWTETDTFDKAKGEWDWTNDPGATGVADHAHYSCKPL